MAIIHSTMMVGRSKRVDEFQERAAATLLRDHGLLTNPIMV
jgi:hypothetical protein